jgi:hypothetical protein
MNEGKNMPSQLDLYIKNQDELVKKYNGKIIAVVDGECMGSYDSRADALGDMLDKKIEPGSFMIILCEPGDRQYMARFHGNVSFKQPGLSD